MPLSDSERINIFNKVKNILQKCSPPMQVSKDKEDVFELIGNKPVPYGSTKKIVPGMYFSSVVARKNMISYYFFPIYFHDEGYLELIPLSKKSLKGKTCFNFKKSDEVIEKELTQLLKKGVTAWKKNGFLIS